MRTSTVVWVVVIILLIVGGVWWFFIQTPSPVVTTPTDNTQATASSTNQTGLSGTVGTAPMSATVTYTSAGFSPKSVTIAKGGTVTFVNQAGSAMWVASDPHPVHTSYDGTSRSQHCAAGYTGPKPFDQCSGTGNFTFTFDKAGSFGYHNHSNDNDAGTIIVQ